MDYTGSITNSSNKNFSLVVTSCQGLRVLLLFSDIGKYWSPVIINSTQELANILEGYMGLESLLPKWIHGSTNYRSFSEMNLTN